MSITVEVGLLSGRKVKLEATVADSLGDLTYLWFIGNGGMGYNYNNNYYHSSFPTSQR